MYEHEDDASDIVSIIPGTGWRVWYLDDKDDPWWQRLVCWALLRSGSVVPMVCDVKGYVYEVDDKPWLIGIVPDELPPSGEMIEEARKRFLASGRGGR